MFIKKIIFLFIRIISILIFPFYLLNQRLLKPLINLIKSELITLKLKLNGVHIGANFRVGKNPTIRIGKNTNIKIGNNVVRATL